MGGAKKVLKLKVFDGSSGSSGIVYSVDAGSTGHGFLEIKAIGEDGNFAVSWSSNTTGPDYRMSTRVFA